MDDLFPPGTDNKSAGIYIECGPRGGKINKAREITIDAGDRLPPTSKKGNMWKKV